MPDNDKVAVYDSATGEKRFVPAHWVGHPTLGKGFRKTAPTTAKQPATKKAASKPRVRKTAAAAQTPAAGDNPKEKS